MTDDIAIEREDGPSFGRWFHRFDDGSEGERRALAVGVVETQDESAPLLARPQHVVERGADVADMKPAGRRRREAGDDRLGLGCAHARFLQG